MTPVPGYGEVDQVKRGEDALSVSKALTLPSPSRLTHTSQHPEERPRWQRGQQPAQPSGRDHTAARQSLLTAREATAQVPHTTCSLLPAPGAWAPHRCTVWQSHPEANRQGMRERAGQQVQTRARARGDTSRHVIPSPGERGVPGPETARQR